MLRVVKNIRPTFPVCLFLVIALFCVYRPVMDHRFINFDDTLYVTENPHVRSGLTPEGIRWAFTTAHASSWHPVTWLSHMLDCQLYGMNPGQHHLTSLLFHIINTLLLFLVLRRMTGNIWQSCFVAALFAFHPLNVESVAWVSERKNVLSAFFWMLTLWGYVRYVERPGLGRYLQVLLFFILGLMAKPMLVTLPFVLLLLDYWPLGRIRIGPEDRTKTDTDPPQRASLLDRVKEKIPLFALSAVSGVATYLGQDSIGALRALDAYPVSVRISNAVVSYAGYLKKMIWPNDLTCFYPHPGDALSLGVIIGSGLLMACITGLSVYAAKRHPYAVVGWLWYIGTLVPVIGLVQVGDQAMADRYTYIPFIGLFIALAWGIPRLFAGLPYRKPVSLVAAGLLISAFAATAWYQIGHWRTDATLFHHMLNVTSNNHIAHNGIGLVLANRGKAAEAIRHFKDAIRAKPNYDRAHINLGNIFSGQGNLDQAVDSYRHAIAFNPNNAKAHNNLAVAMIRQGKKAEAVAHFRTALRINPEYANAHNNLGLALEAQGKDEAAQYHFVEASKINANLKKGRRR